jgi:hypothetical protein
MNLSLAPADLSAIAAAVAEEIERRGAIAAKLADERIAYRERDAAAAIGVDWYTLRNARLAGEIVGRKVGRSFVYSRRTLLAWLETQ